MTTSAGAPARIFLALGALWAAALYVVLAFRLPPRPPSAGSYVVLALLLLFLALAHAALWTALSGFLARLLGARHWPRGFDALLALLVGLAYSWLALSLVKFAYTRAHLRYEDLWFLFGSLRQFAAEGSARERALFFSAAAAPLLLAVVVYVALRRGGPGAHPARATAPAALAALAALALAGFLLTCWRYPYARYAAGTLLPETSWVARRLQGRSAVGDLAHAFVPDPARHARIARYDAPAELRRVNVLVLMLESIPWSRLFGPLARPAATPNLLALARESILFDRAYASATHSDYAQTSILASLHPRKFAGHDYFTDLSYPRTLLWDLLAPLGYRTAVFSCQNERWGNMIAFLKTPALEVFRHSPDWPAAPRRGDGPESKVFEPTPIAAFAEWLAEAPDEPFAAYLNFQATHYPYMVPPGAPEPYQPAAIDFPTTYLSYPRERIAVMENRFYNALAYVDTQVARLVEELRAAGVWENTALLVVSDHGEAFYEHGVPTHGTMLLEEQVRTAMFLRLPGEPPRRIVEPVSVLDALPAIARWQGLPPHGNFQGRSDILAADYAAADRPLLFTIQGMTQEDALLVGQRKYLVNWDRQERALFDLANDPGERHNLLAERPDAADALDRLFNRLLRDQLAYYRARAWEQGWYPPRLP